MAMPMPCGEMANFDPIWIRSRTCQLMVARCRSAISGRVYRGPMWGETSAVHPSATARPSSRPPATLAG